MPYNASLGTTTQKPIALSNSNPLDFRSYFYDAVLFKSRPYQSVQEVLLYLTDPKNRAGHFPIFVSSGALQADGSFTGGLIKKYWFKNGTTDTDLIEDAGQSGGTSNITVNLVAPDSTGNISISSYDNDYFDDGVTTKITINNAYRIGQTVAGLLDVNNLPVTYSHIGGGTVDGAIIRKKGTEFFKRNFQGAANAKWWGAKGDGIADDWVALQVAIDYCIANGITTLFIPIGNYKISKPLLIAKSGTTVFNGATIPAWKQVTLKVFGEGSMWSAGATTITPTFTDAFGLGIQRGKGCIIDGLDIAGKYAPAPVSDAVFYNRELSDCTDGICRQSRYSPNAGIVIDPFSNGQIPADGGYPNMSANYKGNGDQGGSTATTITRCIIENFPVGICSSPNGYTRNAEITRIEHTKFSNCPLWISGSHDQEKANTIFNVAGWNETHTCFATEVYGNATAGNWNIDNVNIAGRCNRFITNGQRGYFPTNINGVYAEGIGTFGDMSTDMVAKVTNSNFNFAYPENTGLQKSYIHAAGIKFENCIFRHYGYSYPIPIHTTGCFFENCMFGGIPVQNDPSGDAGALSKFDNCSVNTLKFGVTGKRTVYLKSANSVLTYGNYVLEESQQLNNGYHLLIKNSSNDAYASITKDTNKAITVVGNSFTFTSSSPQIYGGNEVVQIALNSQNIWFGIVTAISGSAITVSQCTNSLASGTYSISTITQVRLTTFIGDVQAGTNQITNVAVAWGQLNVGDVFESSYSAGKWLRVTAITGSTFTVSENMTTTKVGAYFGNNTTQELLVPVGTNISGITNILVRKGDIIRQGGNADNAVSYLVIQTGWIVPPSGDTRQATWT